MDAHNETTVSAICRRIRWRLALGDLPRDLLNSRRCPEDGLLGFRTPCLMISPYAQREHVSHLVFDHTSVLKLIEWRWALQPLTVRDVAANNLADALQFTNPDFRAKTFDVPVGPFGNLCLPGSLGGDREWLPLLQMAANAGWPVDVSIL